MMDSRNNSQGFSQSDLDAVADNPELTAGDIAQAVPFDKAFPELAASARRARGPQKSPKKISTTIRLSPDVVAHFRASGTGWQSRIDSALREWIARH